MSPGRQASWTGEARDLWARIEAHRFEDAHVAMDFTCRLARDRGWSSATARAAVVEYRRFCFLAAASDLPVTPSEEVDEVWHAHLTYSRDYWERWCGEALLAPLHHDPTPGGPAAQAVYRAQYVHTLTLYEAWFGPPPEAFWPATHVRFGARPRFRTVDRRRAMVLPRPALGGWLVRFGFVVTAGLAGFPRPAVAAPIWNPLDWHGPEFLALAVVLSAAALLICGVRRRRLRDSGAPTWRGELTATEAAFLAGGPARAADAVVVELLAAGIASLDRRGAELSIAWRPNELPPDVADLAAGLEGTLARKDVIAVLMRRLGRLRASLVERGLVASAEAARRIATGNALVLSPVLLLFLCKVAVGSSRGRPVGLLLLVSLVLVVIGFALSTRPTRTIQGDAALRACRERSARAARAPQTHELGLAFALSGAAVLAGTVAAEYGLQLKRAAAATAGGGCDGGGGGGGDGGGGGGCGGCGGGG